MPGFEEHFERRPTVAAGAIVLRGTRVPVKSVVASLAEGASEVEIRSAFPTLTAEHVRAVVMFAAARALKSLTRDSGDAETDGERDD